MGRVLIASFCTLLFSACKTHREPAQIPYVPLAQLQQNYGTLVTTGNHPTPNQYGTGDRIGLFRDRDQTIWGLPLTFNNEGKLVGCAPEALRNAEVTDHIPAGTAIVGAMNEPTGWRGGTGKLELLLRRATGEIYKQGVNGGSLPNGPLCWAEEPPGPRQQLQYYRLAVASR